MKSEEESLLVTWHVHPGGSITEVSGNVSTTSNFNQPPSKWDIAHANSGINIVVGAGNKQVYFYNSTGVIKQESLKQFMK